MKKILILTILCFCVLPVSAACKLDVPCTASALDNNQMMLNSGSQNNLENNLGTQIQQERKSLNANPFIDNSNPNLNPNPNYNANCQFGICLPERSFTEIIEIED